LIIIPYRQ